MSPMGEKLVCQDIGMIDSLTETGGLMVPDGAGEPRLNNLEFVTRVIGVTIPNNVTIGNRMGHRHRPRAASISRADGAACNKDVTGM
jgi:hypothetical protein